MTTESPERAMYDAIADLWAAGVIGSPSIPWEEVTADERDGWARAKQAALDASPELAEAQATISELRALVVEIVSEVELGTLGQHGPHETRRTLARTADWRKRGTEKKAGDQ